MAKYFFQARAANGQVQTGQIDGTDETEIRVKLKAKGLTPVRIVPQTPGVKTKELGMFAPRVSSRDLQIFTRQLATLVNAGIPVVDSLKMLGEGKRNPMLKNAANAVRESIESGKRLGDAMAAQPAVFDRLYVNMIRAGEEAGILDGILDRLAIYMEKSEKIKKQIKGALFYPVAIIGVAIVVVTLILVFVIPKFQDLYQKSGKSLPALTQFVVSVSDFLIQKWYIAGGVAIAVPWAFIIWSRTPEGMEVMDRTLIRLPAFGDLIQKSSVARMSRTLSTLLSSGVSVIDALDIAARTAGNRVIEEALLRSKESVTSGRPLAAPLSKEPMIPEMVSQMIKIGEQSGTLDTMFAKVADFYEDDVENAVKAVMSLIEPILMVVLGGIIAVLVLAMYLPIFDMASTTGG
jgi:type IV pilus assembly protein PilC